MTRVTNKDHSRYDTTEETPGAISEQEWKMKQKCAMDIQAKGQA